MRIWSGVLGGVFLSNIFPAAAWRVTAWAVIETIKGFVYF
jgi:hypothetical protein